MAKNNKPYEIEYVKEQFEKKDYTLISEEYKNKNTKLDYICNKHKDVGVQHVSFASFSRNKCNCVVCKSESNSKNWHKNRNFKPISDEELYKKHFEQYKNRLINEVGDEYSLVDVHRGKHGIDLVLLHNECNSLYTVNAYKFFNSNNRCQNPECKHRRISAKQMKPKSRVLSEIKSLTNDEYLVLGDYTGTHNNMTFIHNIESCGFKFLMTPHNFIQGGQRCPQCAKVTRREKITKTQEQYEKEIFDLYGDEYVVIGKYINSKEHIKIKHKNCGHSFDVAASKMFYNVKICPYCDQPTKGEQRIINYLDTYTNIKYTYQKYYSDLIGVNFGLLSYDFYIPEQNMLIEYQGEYHDGTARNQTKEGFIIQQEHDRRKRQYAKDHNIKLLEIWYWDFDNIEEILSRELSIAA